MKKKITYVYLIVVFIIANYISIIKPKPSVSANTVKSTNTSLNIEKIEKYIRKYVKKGNIPGIAVSINYKDETYIKCYGYADVKNKIKVDENTKFELASNSKAFTGLAILKLVNENKLHMDDSVQTYIPDFEVFYNGEKKSITIEQLLHHTSGIPFSTIAMIKVDPCATAFDSLIEDLNGIKLNNPPGKKYEYATVNYDILGFIIEKITGMTFESYIRQNIFEPYGLLDTWSITDSESHENMAKGYMRNWGKQREYVTPIYRSNIPAGYMVSDIEDITHWLRVQMQMEDISAEDAALIDLSHEANRRVAPDGTASYAIGWESYQNGGGDYRHSGDNQYFSSYLMFRPEEKIGIGLLCNTSSTYAQVIVEEINRIIDGNNDLIQNAADSNKMLDNLAIMLLVISVLIIGIIIYGLVMHLKSGVSKFQIQEISGKMTIMLLTMLIMLLIGIYMLPYSFGNGLTWNFIMSWSPSSIMCALYVSTGALVLLFLYLISTFFFEKETKNVIISVVFLSVISGIGNAIIIFTINYSIGLNNQQRLNILIYLLIGLLMYICGQKVIRSELIALSNQLICQQRSKLVHRWLGTQYERIEQIGFDRFQATLNNDTEVVSNFVNVLVSSATSFVTMVFCFIYLYILNKLALLLAVIVILLISVIYFIFGEYANKINESARTLQNVFFSYINDLLYGIKELLISDAKKQEFEVEMNQVCESYRDKRVKGANIYANLFILGELLFTLAIAIVSFGFPFLIQNMSSTELAGYIFVLLYLTGPINTVLDGIPNIMNINISWKRISAMLQELGVVVKDNISNEIKQSDVILHLEDVEYEYKKDDEVTFKIGPMNAEFKSGEITFITGGNGSGKSTFAKLLVGLYVKAKGSIMLNGKEISEKELSEYYTSIFSDFHLFRRLYGIDCSEKANEIEYYLRMLKLEDKVKIVDNSFTTIDLSTGQKKRLALLISLVEDKSIYLFDEWAADQDPHFRKYFYEDILPELKKKGKCVIAITHDDRYFDIADHHIKFEFGKMCYIK